MQRLLTLVFPLLAATVSAQTNASLPSACGPENVTYKVSLSDEASIPESPSGMATIVFLEDQVRLRPGHPPCLRCANQVKLAMDGQWMAVDSGLSHASVAIAPGDHHFCALASPSLTATAQPSMYALNVEAGKTYFLCARLEISADGDLPILDLTNINEDEGRFLLSTSKHSSFVQK